MRRASSPSRKAKARIGSPPRTATQRASSPASEPELRRRRAHPAREPRARPAARDELVQPALEDLAASEGHATGQAASGRQPAELERARQERQPRAGLLGVETELVAAREQARAVLERIEPQVRAERVVRREARPHGRTGPHLERPAAGRGAAAAAVLAARRGARGVRDPGALLGLERPPVAQAAQRATGGERARELERPAGGARRQARRARQALDEEGIGTRLKRLGQKRDRLQPARAELRPEPAAADAAGGVAPGGEVRQGQECLAGRPDAQGGARTETFEQPPVGVVRARASEFGEARQPHLARAVDDQHRPRPPRPPAHDEHVGNARQAAREVAADLPFRGSAGQWRAADDRQPRRGGQPAPHRLADRQHEGNVVRGRQGQARQARRQARAGGEARVPRLGKDRRAARDAPGVPRLEGREVHLQPAHVHAPSVAPGHAPCRALECARNRVAAGRIWIGRTSGPAAPGERSQRGEVARGGPRRGGP